MESPRPGSPDDAPLLSVRDLTVRFRRDRDIVEAVRGVSYDLRPGETLGVVGESGSGKTVTHLAMMGLLPGPPTTETTGRAFYREEDLLAARPARLRQLRGHKIAMIFQDPMTSLNPFLTVYEQLAEVTRLHLRFSARQSRRHAVEMLEAVGIPGAARRLDDYPHQFSGGMRQRVMIAIALSCQPDILIADEPTTALDVTIQAQILDLLKKLQDEMGMAIIMITHDLGVVAQICHRVLVMYAGRIVEEAPAKNLFAQPRHPYTRGLLQSSPRWDAQADRLVPITGSPPDLSDLPPGCSFAPRCPHAAAICRENDPPLMPREDVGRHACLRPWAEIVAEDAARVPAASVGPVAD